MFYKMKNLIGEKEMEYKTGSTGSINTASTQTENKHTLYEDKLKELYAELDRLDLHVETLTKRLSKILPNDFIVETPSDVQKQFPVPLIAEMENIKDRITTATNRLMFLHENSAI